MKGIDVYSGTNVTNWQQLRNSGVTHVYIKCTDGATYINPKLTEHYNGAKSVGMLVGGYHFAENNSVQSEYSLFKSTVGKYKMDLKPCLDYEHKACSQPFIKLFMEQNSNLILYGSHNMLDHSGIPINRQWVAEPNTNPVNTRGYAGIQTSWTSKINGISGNADIDMFTDDVLVVKPIIGSVQNMIMRNGESSRRVSLLQSILNVIFVGSIKNIDGNFGPITLALVDRYQKAMGLPVTGFVDVPTITMLLTDIKNNYFKI